MYKKSIKTPSTENKFKFKQYRNKLNHQNNQKRYYKSKFEAIKNNTRQKWTLINEVINKKRSESILPDAFVHDNEEITDPVKVAQNSFQHFPRRRL